MTDCSLENPCEQGICYIGDRDENEANRCIGEEEAERHGFTIFIGGKPYTGDLNGISDDLEREIDLSTIACQSGTDITGALDFAEFQGKGLSQLRSALEGEDILGFYNFETNTIFCEVASTLFEFWRSKMDNKDGILLSKREVDEVRNNSDSLREISRNKDRRYFIPLSPTLLHTYIGEGVARAIIADNQSFFLILPTNSKWVNPDRTVDMVFYDFSVVLPIGPGDRHALTEREEEEIIPEVIEEPENIREIKNVILRILEENGATDINTGMSEEQLISEVRRITNEREEIIGGVYASLINERVIEKRHGKVYKPEEKEAKEMIEYDMEVLQRIKAEDNIQLAQEYYRTVQTQQRQFERILTAEVNRLEERAEALKNTPSFERYFTKMDNLEDTLLEFQRSLPRDSGRKVYRDGSTYIGTWRDGKRDGPGIYTWANGDGYYGNWKEGMMSGVGIFVWHNNDVYIGHWNRGRMNGHGLKLLANRDLYYGEWVEDRAQGFGFKSFGEVRDLHIGEYKEDKRDGIGMYKWRERDEVYYGDWVYGKMDGFGMKKMGDGSFYIGTWKQDMADGFGIKYFEGGDFHVGEYQNDHRKGYGIYFWSNGDMYLGNWERGDQNGQGTYVYSNGDIYIGTWMNGKKHGEGVFTSGSTNESVAEFWENGQRVSREGEEERPVRRALFDVEDEERDRSIIIEEADRRELQNMEQIIARLSNLSEEEYKEAVLEIADFDRECQEYEWIRANSDLGERIFNDIAGMDWDPYNIREEIVEMGDYARWRLFTTRNDAIYYDFNSNWNQYMIGDRTTVLFYDKGRNLVLLCHGL